jgi:adenylate cyclase
MAPVANGPTDPKIVALLHELGASDDVIAAAAPSGRLAALAVDLVLTRDFTLSVDDVADECGLSVSDLVELYRLLGISLVPGAGALGAGDLALLDALGLRADDDGNPGVHATLSPTAGENLLRVIGMSIARIAEAAVSTFIQDVEQQLQSTDVEQLDWVRAEAQIGEVAHRVAPGLGTLFIHHLVAAIGRQRVSQIGVSERSMARVAIGFVDLVGFTPLSQHLSPRELVDLVTRFEERAFDITSAHDGRVVKHIGDEVMYTALTADAAAEIALALLAEFSTDIRPRGGLCFGEALTLRGDYYGPVVNLAARLVDEAVPGEVLIDLATADVLERVAHEPAGRRLLKGFEDPVAVCSLVATG